jgi:hypothetical protein
MVQMAPQQFNLSEPLGFWDAWRTSDEIKELAEAWIAKSESGWTDEDDRLSDLFADSPDKALATIFAIMQLTDKAKTLGGLGAGHFENFLGIHAEKYLGVLHSLGLQHRRLREVLDNVWQGAMPKSV